MLPDISKFLPGEKVYEDILRPSAQELGGIFKNIVKTARFLLAPCDYLAGQQDRFQNYLKRVAEKVPQENLVEASPQIVVKAFEALRYLEEDNILTEMYINLLASSVDKTRKKFAHPSFPLLLSNISRDEAIIIYFLHKNKFNLTQYSSFNISKNLFSQRETIRNDFPIDQLDFSDNFFIYMNHLHSLNIAGVWQDGNQVPDFRNGIQVGVTINNIITLQEFGKLLADACAVDDITKFGDKCSHPNKDHSDS